MKILWFTNTPSNAAQEFGYHTYGGGWITSLENLLIESGEFELGLCFFYNGDQMKVVKKGKVEYFGIPFRKTNKLERIISRHFNIANDEDAIHFENVIKNFKPDLIHVFGTELGYGKILMNRYDKVLFHLQGLIGPYTEVYFPPGFRKFQVFLNSSVISMLKGYTYFHDYLKFKKWTNREQTIIKYWKYFSGRTTWDKNYIQLLNPTAIYFHCDELLRSEFYNHKWNRPSEINENTTIVIGSTINPNLYKGLDLVYKTIELISGYKIQWKIFGVNKNDMYCRIVRKTTKQKKNKCEIMFYGQLNSSELITQLQTCHLFVHPSYIDNSPNSVCEAMLLGMPVLSSSVGGIKTLLKDGESGLLFNPYDKYDLAGLIIYALRNYDLMVKLGLNAREIASKRHMPESILRDITNIYSDIYHDKS
jgi:glycosyltransferase involved in cell wall biosynthesis